MYTASETRYDKMKYNRCGRSGLFLPAFSLGMWHNFGTYDSYENMVDMVTTAFDLGITHFDLANNYGPEAGSAEENFGKMLKNELSPYRDELIISTKAGYYMWPGPYGDHGSRKYLIASLDQSLKRLGLDYVDIFYHHRPDKDTPLEETALALAQIVRSGKALYAGVSNYSPEDTKKLSDIMRGLGVPLLIHQPRYNMLERGIENGLQQVLCQEGIGSISFCPLAQGLLTGKYINGIPSDSRAAGSSKFLTSERITPEVIDKITRLNEIAKRRNQTLAQMALSWNLRGGKLTSVLIGASKPRQIIENVAALENQEFSDAELKAIDEIMA